jgi:hypothetical protein
VRVIITEWALQAYLDMVQRRAFTPAEYWGTVRPDVERLKAGYPSQDPKFTLSKFWGPAQSPGGQVPNGFKMKWHNLGPGGVQLRLMVGLIGGSAYLCQAFVKKSSVQDKREGANLKRYMNLIAAGQYQYRGDL